MVRQPLAVTQEVRRVLQRKRLGAAALGVLVALVAMPAAAAPLAQDAPVFDMSRLLATSLAWFVPIGLVLLAAAGVPEGRGWQTALAGVAGAAIGVLAFFVVGFALAFGGIGLVYDKAPELSGLIWEWTVVTQTWGPKWGMVGLSGWAMEGSAATAGAYTLFLAQAPWVATATLIPLLALRGRAPAFTSLLGGLLVGGILYPLATNWVWGGGWLANLGVNLNLGHGFVDFAGGATVHLLAAAAGIAGLLVTVPRRARQHVADSEPIPMPPVHLPLLASIGAVFILAGSLGWGWGNPLLDLPTLMPARGIVNALIAAASGALVPLAYTWFVTDRPDPLMAARGLAAGAVAGAAFGPFVPPGMAALIGALAGLMVPILTYLLREVLRIDDDTGLTPVHLVSGLFGVLAVGLLADGLAGRGWNGVGNVEYLGVVGQGVTGWRAAAGMIADWPGQFQAQLIGSAALFLMPFLAGTLLFGLLAAIAAGLRRVRRGEAAAEAAGDAGQLKPAPEPVMAVEVPPASSMSEPAAVDTLPDDTAGGSWDASAEAAV